MYFVIVYSNVFQSGIHKEILWNKPMLNKMLLTSKKLIFKKNIHVYPSDFKMVPSPSW